LVPIQQLWNEVDLWFKKKTIIKNRRTWSKDVAKFPALSVPSDGQQRGFHRLSSSTSSSFIPSTPATAPTAPATPVIPIPAAPRNNQLQQQDGGQQNGQGSNAGSNNNQNDANGVPKGGHQLQNNSRQLPPRQPRPFLDFDKMRQVS
jgi:hypothetical protein